MIFSELDHSCGACSYACPVGSFGREKRGLVVASGYSINGQVKKTLDAGAAGYVGKPYQLIDLLENVQAVLDQEN